MSKLPSKLDALREGKSSVTVSGMASVRSDLISESHQPNNHFMKSQISIADEEIHINDVPMEYT